MDFDDAKENIKPLAQGRNASILHASLRSEAPQDMLARRKELEKEIHDYSGDDPLSAWYNYIEWIEQSYPSGGKESGLQEVLCKCLYHFESEERYKQDRRMVKLYIKFIDGLPDPAECYQQLFNAGIGTMVADFYIAWAYCYDLVGNTKKADEIFLRGIECRAQPLDELQEARQHFGFSVAQRLMYKDNDPIREETNRQLHERRLALTSLRGHRRKQTVGSIRTGSAIKSSSPGKIKIDLPSTSSVCGNTQVRVFKDENENPNVITSTMNSTSANEVGKSVVRSIIDAARNQENQKEPGPWNKGYNRKKGKLFGKSSITNELGFEIYEDNEDDTTDYIKTPCIPPVPIADNENKLDKPFIYPANFCKKSKPIKDWLVPVTSEEMPDKHTIPEYNKCKLYPRPNVEFQPEELKAYNILKKHEIQNEFTKERDVYWGCGPKYNIRLHPHFANKSKPQKMDSMDELFPIKIPGLAVAFEEIYNKEENVERQFEEILALRIKRNETIIKNTDMEETMCVTSEKIKLRKSFFPMRKSLAPGLFKVLNKTAVTPEQNESVENLTINKLSDTTCSNSPTVSKNIENKLDTVNKSKNQNETSQTESRSFVQKHYITSLVPNTVTEKNVTGEMSSKTFELYKDDSLVEAKKNVSPLLSTNLIATDGDDFRFKTPALPIENSTPFVPVSNKLTFEIHEDENFIKKSQNLTPKPDSSCSGSTYFDAEETCSTQTFNLFLKAQSVSTPMSIARLQPQRQFGNILKEISSPSIPEQKSNKHHLTSSTDVTNYTTEGTPAVAYSPPREQLSTIFETSEQGTTQGTHTTGATTKSTLSSPEFKIDSQGQTATNAGTNQPQAVLETVKELSCEASFIADKMINSPKNRNVADKNTLETPGRMRFKNKCTSNGLEFSIFEDSLVKDKKQVGNFSRLERKEDTANGSAFKDLHLIRFQDDKTETISKMLLTSQAQFQDDKTETINKIILEPPHLTQFQEDRTETMSQILSRPSLPNQFSEDKTETISKFMLMPREPTIIENEKVEPILTKDDKNQKESMNQADSFEFFGETPPKQEKQLVKKPMQRFFDEDTSDMQKAISFSNQKLLFEDNKNKHSSNLNNILKDSFLPDVLLPEDNQSEITKAKVKSKSKSIFRDSFIPDFSIVEEGEIKQNQLANANKTTSASNLPEFSAIKNISNAQTNPRNQLMLSDFLHVSAGRPNESIVKSSQQTEPRYLKYSATQSSVQTNLGLEENKVDSVYWKRSSNVSTTSNGTQNGTTFKNILMDTFMKDFSDIKEPSPSCNDNPVIAVDQPRNDNLSTKFHNDSSKQISGIIKSNNQPNFKNPDASTSKASKLNIIAPDRPSNKSPRKEKTNSSYSDDKYFELNCETEMFGTNISMIKNSTWLPNHGPSDYENAKQLSQIQEKSLHIKPEYLSSNSLTCSTSNTQYDLETANTKKSEQNLQKSGNDFSIEQNASKLAAIKLDDISKSPDKNQDNCEMSIYYKQTPKTPKARIHIWDDEDSYKTPDKNSYIHANPDHNQTLQVIENMCIDPNVNPFDVDLINAFLEQHYVISYLESLPTCKLVGCIQRLRPHAKINIKGTTFDVIKLIGEGAYGAVYCGKETTTGKLVAMKQEKPPNFWEYYICLEVQERIQSDEMLQAYMSVDYALIGNNSSIIISKFSPFSSLISVCNKIKKHTLKNVDEYVVMLLASELLEIIDHLHAVNIIHADVKADNFLLMNKITYPPTERHLQLIDFGVSIDMKLFKQGQTFSFVHNDNSFKCPEMREGRPWTYQLDLHGLAGVLHVLLFGKYMDIERNTRGFWMHKTHVPRYLNKNLWDEIFKTLLNVRDCNSMPNLQDLRALLKKEVEEREKYVIKMVNEFNRALN